ncbi:MAG: murein DD-endopeptidase MepM/ murein hydrolase activator NlpD [Candidatus Endobugula sp.]|jgi:murein DD-endopeptidase MepM/ murein hydrolase activator NlpD
MSLNRFLLTSFTLLLLSSFFAHGQNPRKSLEAQKLEILKKIQETEKILSQTSSKKASSIGRLRALNQQIQTRTSLIGAIKGEVNLLDSEMGENQSIIDAMGNDLLALKAEYAEMIYTTQKTSKGFNELTFLFASSTFNQLFMRMKYIQQYSEARKNQGKQILIVQLSLGEQIAEIETQRNSKRSLLTEELTESEKLENLVGQQKQLVTQLTQDEKRIKQELDRQKKAEKELTGKIEAIIEAERKAALLSSVDLTELTSAFEKEKGRLPWPVDQGFVSSKYGEHKHPTIKTVTINNPGIDIQTNENATVKVVFAGKISRVLSPPGWGNSIVIQHGEFFTIYTGLRSVVVKRGDIVTQGQTLGQVLTDKDNISVLKFRVTPPKSISTVNPELWLQRKSK